MKINTIKLINIGILFLSKLCANDCAQDAAAAEFFERGERMLQEHEKQGIKWALGDSKRDHPWFTNSTDSILEVIYQGARITGKDEDFRRLIPPLMEGTGMGVPPGNIELANELKKDPISVETLKKLEKRFR